MNFISGIDTDKAKENFRSKLEVCDVYDWINRSTKHGEIYGYIYKNKIVIVVNPSLKKKNALTMEQKYCFRGKLVRQNNGTILKGNITPVYFTYILIFLFAHVVSVNNYLNQSINENIFMFLCICIMLGIVYCGNCWLIKNLWSYATREELYNLIEECLHE